MVDDEVSEYVFRGTIGIPAVDIYMSQDRGVEKLEFSWQK